MTDSGNLATAYQDRFGRYELHYQNRILNAKISGAMGSSIAVHFCRDLTKLCLSIPDKTWGYFGDLSACEAYTQEGVDIVYQAHLDGLKAGCVIDAYMMTSSVVHHQVNQVRTKLGAKIPLDELIFDSQSEAESFIHQFLKNSVHDKQ